MSGPGDTPIGLEALERRLRQDLDWLDYPPKSWCPAQYADGQRVWDVIVIGAGMCGLATAAALRRVGLDNISIRTGHRRGKRAHGSLTPAWRPCARPRA